MSIVKLILEEAGSMLSLAARVKALDNFKYFSYPIILVFLSNQVRATSCAGTRGSPSLLTLDNAPSSVIPSNVMRSIAASVPLLPIPHAVYQNVSVCR
ncbi:MAG: hypothetical protein ABWK01_09285 [Infirmifilum sp.]